MKYKQEGQLQQWAENIAQLTREGSCGSAHQHDMCVFRSQDHRDLGDVPSQAEVREGGGEHVHSGTIPPVSPSFQSHNDTHLASISHHFF